MGEFEAKIVTGTDKKNWFDLFICKLISLTHPFKNLPKNLKCYRYIITNTYFIRKKINIKRDKRKKELNEINIIFYFIIYFFKSE
jgi:hypothetical protein